MSCNRTCRECPYKAVVGTAELTDGVLVLTLPETTEYLNRCKYCFVIGTALPDGIPINTSVAVVVGTNGVQFPVLTCCGDPVLAQQLNTRERYPFRVATTASAGRIVILRSLDDVERTVLRSLNEAVAAAAGGDGA